MSGQGYQQDLLVLPFDHRGSFAVGLLGIRDRRPNAQQREQLAQYKLLICDGFLSALESGVAVAQAAILVDQAYGPPILSDAIERGIITCVPVKKSAQIEFD